MTTSNHGGKRTGAGRKSGPHAPYAQRSVNLSAAAWRFIAAYELATDASSAGAAIERLIRSHPLWRDEDMPPLAP